MNKVVRDKMQREIMTVKITSIFGEIEKDTKFYPGEKYNLEKNILENYEYMIREKAEQNFDFKQPIPYGVLMDESDNIFVYKRGGAGSNAGESRLHQKIAIGVGGHIEREDQDSKNIMLDSLLREIEEEVNIEKKYITDIKALGYINDDTSEVSKVHIGICYLLKTSSINFELLDGELDNGEFVSFEELLKMQKSDEYDIEKWSEIVIDYLKEYFNKN